MELRLIVLLVFLFFMPSVHTLQDVSYDWSGESGSRDTFGVSEDNLTSTCAARSIQSAVVSPYSLFFSTTLRSIQSILHILVSVLGTLLNLFVIVLIAKHSTLQTVSLMVSLQIVVLDLILSLSHVAGFASAAANRWLFGEHGCILLGVIVITTTTARTVLLVAFVIDRFLSVFWTYFYPLHKVKIIVTLSAASWLMCVTGAIIELPSFLDCYSFDESTWFCVIGEGCSKSCVIFSALFHAIVAAAMILPIVLYTVLYCKARKIRKAMAANVDGQSQEEYHRNEWKATITYGLLFTTVLAITTPFLVVSLIVSHVYSRDPPPPGVHVLSVLSFHLITFINVSDPLVIMRNAEVREVISKLRRNAANFFARRSPSVTPTQCINYTIPESIMNK